MRSTALEKEINEYISHHRIFLTSLDDSSDSQSGDNPSIQSGDSLSEHSPSPQIVGDDPPHPNQDEEEFLEIAPRPIVIPSNLLKGTPQFRKYIDQVREDTTIFVPILKYILLLIIFIRIKT